MTFVALFLIWWISGIIYASWVWTLEFDLEIYHLAFIALGCLFSGPFAGLIFQFLYWVDHREKSNKEPTILLKKRPRR